MSAPTKTKTFQNAFAVVIGVGNYIHAASLPASAKDAVKFADLLTAPELCAYPQDNVQRITGSRATKDNIYNGLTTLAQAANPDSTVIVYFSGHGVRVPEGETLHTYLCPHEIRQENIEGTAIPGHTFSELLAAVPAKKMLVIIDACHAGGSAGFKAAEEKIWWKSGLPEDYYQELARGEGRVVIASSKENEVSYVDARGDLSVFTKHLCAALSGEAAVRGDGLVHVLDVFHYINEAVQAEKPNQTPILKVKDMDMNFPVALANDTKGTFPRNARGVDDIRDQIIRNPLQGAAALGRYLEKNTQWAAKRNEVDLKRSELENCQKKLELFGPDPAEKAAKYRATYYLLRVCQELAQDGGY